MSAVWAHFKVSEKENGRYAICNKCSSEISRGGTSSKDFNTSNLITHLKSRHVEDYNEYLKAKVATTKVQRKSSTQSLLTDAFEHGQKLARDSARAKGITNKVMEFIALDDQPFSVVEDVGFRRLVEYIEPRYTLPSRRYFADVCLPETYNVVATHIHELLARDIHAISFTTDIWSSDVSPTSMLSLTAQWVDKDFKLIKVVLHSQEFTGSHTATAISATFENMFDTWKIDKSQVHAVVRDNAKNMAKAMKDSGLTSFGCMAHTLQLAVHEGVLSQRSISDVVAIGRKIVGHFKHSPLAYSRLQALQKTQLGVPLKRLQQDVPTRWNSTFYMLQSLLEQKRTLAAYSADYELPATINAHQWGLVENVLTLLSPFEQLTREISASEASAADVIPSVRALTRLLRKDVDTDRGVKTTKTTLLEAINKRFDQIEFDPIYSIATTLDPRYKDRYFDGDAKQRVRDLIHAQLEMGQPGDEAHSAEAAGNPQQKRARTDEARSTLHDMFDEILEENGPERPRSSASQQLDGYLAEVSIPRNESALEYWSNNHGRFPVLAQMARRYLSAPCTSTDSERLFSAASHIIDEKRNRLSCDKAEMLLFIKKNMPLFLKNRK